jgi:hypothetical protein
MLPSLSGEGDFISRFVPGQTCEIFETSLSYFGHPGACIGGNVGLSGLWPDKYQDEGVGIRVCHIDLALSHLGAGC